MTGIISSDQVAISWNGSALTAVEDCSGINIELATGELLPFGASLKRKAVTGVKIADDVTLKVPMDDTGGSDFVILAAAHKAKTAAALKVQYGATYYRQLTMVPIACNPIPAGGDVQMVEVKLANTGTAVTEN